MTGPATGKGTMAFATIGELGALLARHEVSAVDVAQFFLNRLEANGPSFNAVVLSTAERGLARAVRADAQRARGAAGPMLGVPYGAKDIFSTRGLPTRSGTRAVLAPMPDVDATAVRRLERVGAPLLAKLALIELVGFGTRRPWSSPQGPARSPWDLDRWAGGSSGGSGAAVAAGLVPFALGSETAGSVGSPAAWCGITGYRPSYGLVGRGGMTPLSPSLDKPGVLAHSVDDCALVIEAIAGRDRGDPATRRSHFRAARVEEICRSQIRSLRVGWAESDLEMAAPIATRDAYRSGLRAVAETGVSLVSAELPAELDYRRALDVVMGAEGTVSFAELLDSGEIDKVSDPATRAVIRTAPLSAREYLGALRVKSELAAHFRRMFDTCDVILTTNFALPWPIPRIDREFESPVIIGGNTGMVWAGNLAGLPAVFLPVGWSADGQPVSMQVVGPVGGDATVLAVGSAVQSMTDWHRAIPPHAPPESQSVDHPAIT